MNRYTLWLMDRPVSGPVVFQAPSDSRARTECNEILKREYPSKDIPDWELVDARGMTVLKRGKVVRCEDCEGPIDNEEWAACTGCARERGYESMEEKF